MKTTGVLESQGYGEIELNKAYVKAKITLSPSDYSLKDRVIVMTDPTKFSHMSSTFYMGCDVESELCYRLGLHNYAFELSDMTLPYDPASGKYPLPREGECSYEGIKESFFKNVSLTYKHNNLLMNDRAYGNLTKLYGGWIVAPLMKLSIALGKADSITNQLMLTRLTCVKGLPLDDVVNLRFAEEEIANKKYCGLGWTAGAVSALFYLEMFALGFDMDNPSAKYCDPTTDWIGPMYAEAIRQNYIVAGMHFCEVYRAYRKYLDDTDKKAVTNALFCGFSAKLPSFVSAFGGLDLSDGTYRAPDIDAIMDLPNDVRFERIPALVEDKLKASFPDLYTYAPTSYTSPPKICMPEALLRLFSELHFQAWQDYRVKHFALLLQECKRLGVDISDMRASADASSAVGYALDADAADDYDYESKDFGDMTMGASYGAGGDEGDKPTPTGKHTSSDTSELDTMSNLVSSCDPLYEVKIEDVVSKSDGKAAYESVLAPIEMITKQLTKQIREIKTYNTGGKMSGKSKGKIDPHIMYRYKTDPKIFYDNTYKVKEMDLAFGIVLDQSGSMRCGSGIENGKISLILLHHVLNSLRINHAIVGHTSDKYHQTIVKRYVMFNEDPKHTLNPPYALTKIKAHNGNCDSGALNYMEQYIKRTRNKDKIVIIFSDGEPTECSESELRAQVHRMEAEGIHVIGIGIGFENIKLYYPDHANGKNLKEMIDIMVNILKRYVLEKKD